eukprot:1119100-Pyramimonas_sp.AAC.2
MLGVSQKRSARLVAECQLVERSTQRGLWWFGNANKSLEPLIGCWNALDGLLRARSRAIDDGVNAHKRGGKRLGLGQVSLVQPQKQSFSKMGAVPWATSYCARYRHEPCNAT